MVYEHVRVEYGIGEAISEVLSREEDIWVSLVRTVSWFLCVLLHYGSPVLLDTYNYSGNVI